MAESGLRYVRLGEFAWSRIEPDPGRYRFDWLDEAIDCLAEQGLEIVLCTPTAAPPKWLIDRYPEVLPHDPATGRPRGFGSRRHYDFSSERYLTEALRITEAVAGRYGEHPGVAGWQTDNELCCNDTTLSVSPRARAAFRAWCRQRYGTIEDLNEAWGNVFWSMEYRSFDQIEPPFGAVTQTNPAHQLAYRRFAADQVVRFHRRMIRSLRRLSPGRFITHNFIAMAGTQVDDFALAEGLDFASYDNYPLGHTDLAFDDLPKDRFSRMARTGHPDFATYVQDQTRGLTDGGFWIMEQQPGPVNWARHNPRPAPGMIRLWTLEAFAHGADCVSYFRWRQAPFAQEQMHAGLLRPDDSATPAMGEIRAVRSDIAHIGLRAGLPVPSDAAIVTSVESQWVCEIERQGRGFEFDRVQFQYYAALRALGLNVDFVSAKADLSPYKLIVIPCLPMVDRRLVEQLARTGAQVVIGPRSGSKTADFRIPDTLPPGPLQSLLPVRVLSVETVREDCDEPLEWGRAVYRSRLWREELDPGAARVLATYRDGSAAVARAGAITYLGTLTCDAFLLDLLRDRCREASINMFEPGENLRFCRRGDLCFLFNYDSEPRAVDLPEGAEILLGSARPGPREVCVWRADPA